MSIFALAVENEPRYGGHLVIGSPREPANMNPLLRPAAPSHTWIGQIYNGLLSYDWDMNPHPDLAKSWKISEDGLKWTFYLRDDVTWHDGIKFTAADVKYSLNKSRALSSTTRTVMKTATLSFVELIDDYTIAFHLERPYPLLIKSLDKWFLPIIPKHIYDVTYVDFVDNPANMAPIGTGPFKFLDWVSGDTITLVANEDYFLEGRPYIEKITVRIIPDSTTLLAALEAGEVDYLPSSVSPEMVTLIDANPNLESTKHGQEAIPYTYYFAFNLEDDILGNVLVRQAIAYAIDTNEIVEKVAPSTAQPAEGPVSSSREYYNPDIRPYYTQNIEKANELLDEAGYPKGADGIRFSKRIYCDSSRTFLVKTIEIIKEQLKLVGIDAKIQPMELATAADKVWIQKDFDMWTHPYSVLYPTEFTFNRYLASSAITGKKWSNGWGYSNPEFDNLLDKGLLAETAEERLPGVYRLQEILAEELPMYFLMEGRQLITAYNKDWVDIVQGPFALNGPINDGYWIHGTLPTPEPTPVPIVGETGDTGDTGAAGAVGPKGDKGDTGPAGTPGNTMTANLISIAAVAIAIAAYLQTTKKS